MKVIAFVPARSRSTRLKNKNIKLISGRPLIFWTVVKAIKSKKFDKIIFSSDSKRYYKILLKFLKKDKIRNSIVEFDYRNKKHTKTKSKIFDYLKYDFIKKYNFRSDDLIVQMLPTCPLRSITTIKKIIDYSKKTKRNSFSVCEYDFHVSFAIELKKNSWVTLYKNSPIITGKTQSQDQKKFYHPNGSIYCLFAKSIKKNLNSIYQNAYPVVVPRKESLDIDSFDDFQIAKKLFKL